MLKKWLLPGALVLVLASLGLLAPWWWPRLLDLAGSRSAQIEGLGLPFNRMAARRPRQAAEWPRGRWEWGETSTVA